jgi:transcription elongation factor Elf1
VSGPSGPWASYRCPVCGHTDGVQVRLPGPFRFQCSHCGAELEAKAPAADEEHLRVQVRKEPK